MSVQQNTPNLNSAISYALNIFQYLLVETQGNELYFLHFEVYFIFR